MTCNKLNRGSDNQDDDDCVIVDVTPASVICLDEGETEINLPEASSNRNIISNHMHNLTLDSISSVGDSLFNNNPDDSKQLFVFDPKPGFNGSRIPLYHSITSCAQSTPLRDNGGPDAINTEGETFNSAYKSVSVTPQSSRKKSM